MAAGIIRRGLSAALVGFVAACAAGTPAPQDQYYRIDGGVPEARLASPVAPGVVMVDRFAVEGLTSGRAINFVDPAQPNKLQQYFYHHWAEPPNVMLRDALVTYMRESGAVETAITPVVRTDADFVVTGSINKLERRLGSPITALIELEIAVTRFDDGDLLHVGTYSAEVPAEGPGIDDTITAFDRGLADIFQQFLSDAIQKR
jgi:ABC-type uncharacterized transport system auxiliary subunit